MPRRSLAAPRQHASGRSHQGRAVRGSEEDRHRGAIGDEQGRRADRGDSGRLGPFGQAGFPTSNVHRGVVPGRWTPEQFGSRRVVCGPKVPRRFRQNAITPAPCCRNAHRLAIGGVEQAVVETAAMADDLAAHHRHDHALHSAPTPGRVIARGLRRSPCPRLPQSSRHPRRLRRRLALCGVITDMCATAAARHDRQARGYRTI